MGNKLQEALNPSKIGNVDVLLQSSLKVKPSQDYVVQGAFWNFPETFLSKRDGANSSIDQVPGYVDQGYNLVCWTIIKDQYQQPYQTVILDYRFPINPGNIQITVPAAASNTMTMHGMHEESNGAPLRNITISGSMGVTPNTLEGFIDASLTSLATPTVLGQLEHAFSNTISAVNNVVTQVQGALSSFDTDLTDPTAVIVPQSKRDGKHTGMGHIHKLARFLDWYLEAKKTNTGLSNTAPLVLAFEMHKDRTYYDCTLKNFSITKPPGSLEYNYSIQLTAFARRHTSATEAQQRVRTTNANTGEPNILARTVQALRRSRGAIVAARGAIQAVGQDIDFILSPIKEVILLGSELSGLATDLSDFSSKLFTGRGFRGVLIDALADLGPRNRLEIEKAKLNIGRLSFGGDVSYTASKDRVNDALQDRRETRSASRNRKKNTLPTSAADPDPDTIDIPDIVDAIFDDPDGNLEFFASISTDDIAGSSKAAADVLQAEKERVSLITLADLLEKRINLNKSIAAISASLGGAHPTYDRIYRRNTPENDNVAVAPRQLRTEDIALLSTLNDASLAMDMFILEFKKAQAGIGENYYTFFARSALDAGLEFAGSQSKFYVPMPTGVTIEQLAIRYLGKADRWLEIVALNGLKSPYIDEDGFQVPLQGNGSGNQICVTTSENLHINQTIKLFSDTQSPSVRRIDSIDEVTETKTLMTVSGDEDLHRFREDENAYFQAFLPDTVNSSLMVAIPSAVPVNIPGTMKVSPDSQDLSRMLYTAKADFKLTFSSRGDEADVAFGAGDVLIARGIHNIVQAANTIVLTKQGDLLHRPHFGNPIASGINTADTNASQIYAGLIASFSGDNRFRQIIANRVRIRGPVAAIDLLLDVDGSDAFLPLTVAVPRV